MVLSKKKYTKSDFVGIDLFAGAGGLSLGAHLAGVDVKAAVEVNIHAVKTYIQNHPYTFMYPYDINKFGKKEINSIINKSEDKIKILFGGPPCQGFSTSNIRGRRINNPTNWLFKEYLRVVKLWHPDWVVIENVKGLIDTENGFFLNYIKNELSDSGYTVCHWILNSADFGVPQRRNRLFIIGSKQRKQIKKPEPLSEKHITVEEAISDLPDLENGASENEIPYKCIAQTPYAKKMRMEKNICGNHMVSRNSHLIVSRYKYIPQGGNWKNIPDELMMNYKNKNNCHTGIYHRLKADEPSVVLGNYRKNMLIHPYQHRGLSVREAARLQSFPDSYDFLGSLNFQQQQVANAVPPLLAQTIFEEIIRG